MILGIDLKKVKTNQWIHKRIEDVCLIDPKRNNINLNDNDLVSFGMMTDLGEHFRVFSPESTKPFGQLKSGAYTLFQNNDILLAKMTPCFENGKSGVALNLYNGIGFGSTEFYVLRCSNQIIPDFLYYIVSSDKFINDGKFCLVGTTGRRRLLKQFVAAYPIPLPPLDEQQRIVDLFHSLDECINRLQEQEKNLKSLLFSMINRIISDQPVFGNLLTDERLTLYKFNIIARKLTRVINPIEMGLEKIVTGRNLETEDLRIRSWDTVGVDPLGPAFHILFQPGDILYGSRRTYLKKVGLADFEGVCANTTFVIQANEEIILQGLLKYLMLSERFTQFSVGVSKGSTNPYINWKDLDNFEVKLPGVECQKQIILVLDNIVDTIEKHKEQQNRLNNLKQILLNEILGGSDETGIDQGTIPKI